MLGSAGSNQLSSAPRPAALKRSPCCPLTCASPSASCMSLPPAFSPANSFLMLPTFIQSLEQHLVAAWRVDQKVATSILSAWSGQDLSTHQKPQNDGLPGDPLWKSGLRAAAFCRLLELGFAGKLAGSAFSRRPGWDGAAGGLFCPAKVTTFQRHPDLTRGSQNCRGVALPAGGCCNPQERSLA